MPGVDPSRVNTPGELAACLNGLRRRRDLAYEMMESAAAELRSRPGGSRLEPLPKSTVGEIVTGKRLPTKGKLLTFLAVCEVAPADLAQWEAAWERASTADLARPVGGVRVRDARPRLLGVHAAISVPGVPDEVPPEYVPRDTDTAQFGVRAQVAAAAERGGFVLLVGGSSVGKTRSAAEAVRALLPDWWLVHPAGPAEVVALAQMPMPQTVVWLDELQDYLDGEHGLTGGVVRALLGPPHRVVIIGTLWPDRHAAYTAVPAYRGPDPHARERQVLDLAAVIRIAPAFSPAEQERARAAAGRDARLKIALESAGYGLTQTLAAAPQLVARWEGAQTASPYAWAVLTAALDAARLGARAPLSADFLCSAAVDYCTSQQQAEAPGNWFEQALAYATEKLHGAVAALSPAGSGMGRIAGYTVADYLTQHASRERYYARVPASTWDALTSHIRDPADVARLADSASNRLLYCYAIPLYRNAIDAGDRDAAWQLTRLLEERGDLDGLTQVLRARAEAGDMDAIVRLVQLLAERGDPDGLRALADAGDEDAAFVRAKLLARRGDLEGLRALADAGNKRAASQLARLLEERGDLDGLTQVLRGLADVGDMDAIVRLVRLLARRGDLEGLRALADAGNKRAAFQLARLLVERGDLDGAAQVLRARAEAGDRDAASRLARLLAERGDLEGLRARAEAGDRDAASRLSWVLAERGDLDGAAQVLRAQADAGDVDAAAQLSWVLAERGDLEGLRALADAGNEDAAFQLSWMLAERGDLEGMRARAEAGDRDAASRLSWVLEERGDLDGLTQVLRGRAEVGDRDAATWLADLLEERGDLEGLRALADAGDRDAALQLVQLLARRGDLEGLRALADAGDKRAASQLVQLLARRGDLEGLRALADADDKRAASQLVQLLARRGDLDELRTRADARDRDAAYRLADLLARRGDLDGLRALTDAGDHYAAGQLPNLLAQQGRDEEAKRLRRFGLNPDGSIARE